MSTELPALADPHLIDAEAGFVFVDDPSEVPADATPFDMRGVELSHHGPGSSTPVPTITAIPLPAIRDDLVT